MKLNRILGAGSKILTDGGLENPFVFHKRIQLKFFADFELLNTSEGKSILKSYYMDYQNIAKDHNLSFLLETPTWRANKNWGEKLRYSQKALIEIKRLSVLFFQEMLDDEGRI